MILQAYDFLELHRRYNCVANGRLRPMGQYCQWDRTGTAHRSGRAVWSDDKFADDIFGNENGQDRPGAVWLNADMSRL